MDGADPASLAAEAAVAVLQRLGLLDGAHDNAGAPAIRPVTIKAPPFWPEETRLWFVRLEAQFNAAGITSSKTKFNHVVSALDNAAIQEVAKAVETPRPGEEYESVKEALMAAFGRTQAAKNATLFALNGLGDRRPSSLYRHIDALATDRDQLVQALFLSQLPPDVRGVLAARDFPSGAAMAEAADRIIDSRLLGGQPSTSVVDVQAVARQPKNKKSGKQSEEEPFICYKHRKFGYKAKGCESGCLFSDAPPSGNAMASRQ